MSSAPTIKDVARVANVHFTTVSMALRNHPSLPLKTRERIQAVAKRLGYQRNEIFAALTKRRSRNPGGTFEPILAYLTNEDPKTGFLKLNHQKRLLEGARSQALKLGYALELFHLAPGHLNTESFLQVCLKKSIRGLVIGSFLTDNEGLEGPLPDLSVVKIESRHFPPGAPFVSLDPFASVHLAFTRLRALGYRRIGLAVGQHDESVTDGAYSASLFCLHHLLPAKERVPPLFFKLGTREPEQVSPQLIPWVKQLHIDAVLCNWRNVEVLLRGVSTRAHTPLAHACLCLEQPTPSLAGIVVPFEQIGAEAITQLATQLRASASPSPVLPLGTFVTGYWADGASAPPIIPSRP